MKGASMATPMLAGMLVMVFAFWMYTIAIGLVRVRNIILDRERHTEWVKHAVA
jgi:heme exporter protein C